MVTHGDPWWECNGDIWKIDGYFMGYNGAKTSGI
jgi:hypothetical protein